MRNIRGERRAAYPLSILGMLGIALLLSGCEGRMQAENEGRHSDSPHPEVISLPSIPAASVKRAQEILAELGYEPGPVDGVLGKKTRIALKHFQVDEEIEIDGRLTPAMLDRLNRAAAQRKAALQNSSESRPAGDTAEESAKAEPQYEVDDVYVYSDGRVETVTRVGPERISWTSSSGEAYITHRNFILPPISWKHGRDSKENIVLPVGGSKWPAASRDAVVFRVVPEEERPQAEEWTCASGETKPVAVLAGEFVATTMECQRKSPPRGTWKKRIWYFVPEIGHYVRRTEVIQGTGKIISTDLVAILPGRGGWPTAARGGLDWAIQGALDEGRLEKIVEWRSSAVGAIFEIRVSGKIGTTVNAICRRYEIRRVGSELPRLFPAIACRKAGQERWLIPGIDPGAVQPGALQIP